jgi:hypothetical protein
MEKMFSNLFWGFLMIMFPLAARTSETVNSTQIKIENNSAQRDYQEQGEGKVLPFRYIG